jgi:hypothetical protein
VRACEVSDWYFRSSASTRLLQLHKHLSHLLVLRRPHPRHRIPLGTRGKPLRPAPRVPTYGDIVKHIWVLINRGVQKPNRAFTRLQSLLVQQIHNACENRRRRRRAANTARLVEVHGCKVEAQRGDVGVGAPGGIENGLAVLGCVFLEVLRYGFGLPGGLREDAGEAAAGVVGEEAVGGGDGLFAAVNRRVEEGGCADGCDLRGC